MPGFLIESSLEFLLYGIIQDSFNNRNIDIYTFENTEVSATESFREQTEKFHAHLNKKVDTIVSDGQSTSGNTRREMKHIRTHDVGFAVKHVVSSADDFRALPSKARRCLYPPERKLSLGRYSEGDCFLECAGKLASERCGCVPWFLKAKFMHEDMCEEYGNRLAKCWIKKQDSGKYLC